MSGTDRNDANELTSALRADWTALGAETDFASESLAHVDATTRATVEWMRAGWEATHTASVPPLPLALARHVARGRSTPCRRRASAAVFLAAAAVLAAVRFAPPSGAPSDPPTAPSHVARNTAPERVPTAIPEIDLAPLRAAARITDFQPDEYVERPDGVELVRGDVRIVLLDH